MVVMEMDQMLSCDLCREFGQGIISNRKGGRKSQPVSLEGWSLASITTEPSPWQLSKLHPLMKAIRYGWKLHKVSIKRVLHRFSAAHLYYNTVWLTMEKSMQQNQRYHLFFKPPFFFLVKTWCLHYPQCNATAYSSVRYTGVHASCS